MPAVSLDLTASPSDDVQSYWITVHDQPVTMNNDAGSVNLASPGTYILVWHFIGNEGATVGIQGDVNGSTVVQVKQSTIPAGQISGAGISRFSV